MPFFKLDAGILDSTIWAHRIARSVFLTSGLMAVPYELTEPKPQIKVREIGVTGWMVPAGWYGFIAASADGIARRDGCALEEALDALQMLGEPDPLSRSAEFDGRRLVRVDGGYLMLNYAKYRERDLTNAERQARWRAAEKQRKALLNNGSDNGNVTRVSNNNVTQRATVTEVEVEVEVEEETTTTVLGHSDVDDVFEVVWKFYPKRDGGNSKRDALKAWNARIRAGISREDLAAGAARYAAWVRASGNEGTRFVQRASTFFGPGEHWAEAWASDVPRGTSPVGREAVDKSASEAFDGDPSLGQYRGRTVGEQDLLDVP